MRYIHEGTRNWQWGGPVSQPYEAYCHDGYWGLFTNKVHTFHRNSQRQPIVILAIRGLHKLSMQIINIHDVSGNLYLETGQAKPRLKCFIIIAYSLHIEINIWAITQNWGNHAQITQNWVLHLFLRVVIYLFISRWTIRTDMSNNFRAPHQTSIQTAAFFPKLVYVFNISLNKANTSWCHIRCRFSSYISNVNSW